MSYIDSRSKVLSHLDRLIGWKRGEKPFPVTVEWDLSNRCALGCQDCHFAHTHTRGPWASRQRALPLGFEPGGDMANEELVRRGLREMAMAGVKGIVWSGGGEPTTHPQVLEIVEYATSLGLHQGMYTFGGLLNGDESLRLASSLDWVVVSLDTVNAETYAKEKGVPESRFAAACNGIRKLSFARKAIVGVSFLLHAGNWERCREMLALARACGGKYTTFRPTIQTSPASPALCTEDREWITDALKELVVISKEPDVEVDLNRFEQYRDWKGRNYHTCYGIRFNTTVTPDGKIWVCPQRRGFPASCVGDLSKESFAEAWAKHPGSWEDFSSCRVMCRLHLMNETLSLVYDDREHGAFL